MLIELNNFKTVDTYTATGTGTILQGPCKSFSIQVKGTTTAAGSWSVTLEGGNDGVNFTTIATHSSGDGSTVFSTDAWPCMYYRSNCGSLTLNTATNIVVSIMGMP